MLKYTILGYSTNLSLTFDLQSLYLGVNIQRVSFYIDKNFWQPLNKANQDDSLLMKCTCSSSQESKLCLLIQARIFASSLFYFSSHLLDRQLQGVLYKL